MRRIEDDMLAEPTDPPRPMGLCLRLVGKPQCAQAGTGDWLVLTPKAGALLLLLAVEGATPRATLSTHLWPEGGAGKPRVNLRGLLRDLRVRSGHDWVRGSETLELAPGVQHDLHALTGPVADLAQAPAGDLLGAYDYTELDEFGAWLALARERWRAARQRALHALADRLQRSGPAAAAAAVIERLLSDDPLDEQACRRHMQWLYERGDAAAALAAMARLRAALRRELGADLSQPTRALATLIELGLPAAPPPPPAVAQTPLTPDTTVAREAEMQAVHAAWAAGQRVWVEGEAGIGKTRLLAEMARRQPACVLAAALPGDGLVPFASLTRLLRALRARARPVCAPDTVAELARLLPEMGAAPAARATTAVLVQALAAALRAWQGAGVGPLLLDDVQWADTASLTLLLPALAACALPHVLFAARPGAQAAPMEARLQTLDSDWTVLRLRPLDAAEVRALLQALSVTVADPEAWAAALTQRTLGSPLHVIETLRALRSRIGEQVFAGPPPAAADLPVPAQLEALVQARLDRLAAPERQLAQLAALAGGLFSVPLAKAVMGRDELGLAGLWARLETEGVLRDDALAHDTLRAPLLASVPAPLARALHAQVAEHGQAQGAPAAELAGHWQRAQRWAAAAGAFERAAGEAFQLNARGEELRLADEAAVCCERLEQDAEVFRLRVRALEPAVELLAADALQARVAWLQQAAQSDAQHLEAAVAEARVQLMQHRFAPGLEAARRAVALAAGLREGSHAAGGSQTALRAWALLASALAGSGQMHEARAVLDRTGPEVEAAGDARRLLEHLGTVGFVGHWAGDFDHAAAAYARALPLAEALGDASEAMAMASGVATSTASAGDYARSLDFARVSERWRQRVDGGDGIMAGSTLNTVGFLCLRLGRYAEALQVLGSALDVFHRCQAQRFVAVCQAHLATACVELGRADLARQALGPDPAGATAGRLSLGLAQAGIDKLQGLPVLPRLLDLQGTVGSGDTVPLRLSLELALVRELAPEAGVERCRALLQEGKASPSAQQAARLLGARACLATGRAEQALAWLAQALEGIATRRPLSMYYGEVWWIAHQVLAAAGRAEEAADALSRGREWILEEALPQVPVDLRDSFRHANPVNAALLGAAVRAAARR
jgi:DNA-binding SARP family transcriptional activator